MSTSMDAKMPSVDIKKVFGSVVSGSFLSNGYMMKQMPFVLLIVLLSLIYINNRFMYEGELKKNYQLTQELQNVKYRSLTLSKELLEMGRRSGVQNRLKSVSSSLQESYKPMIVVD